MPTNVCLVKVMVFPVVMYGCESWAIKKAEHGRIDAFELWCCRGLFRVPWTTRRSNQSILKEISPVCSLEGVMLKLKLQYFGHLVQGADSLEKILMLGKIEGRRRRGWQRKRCLVGITDSMDMGLGGLRGWWWTGRPGVLQFIGLQRVGHDWATELNWTAFITLWNLFFFFFLISPPEQILRTSFTEWRNKSIANPFCTWRYWIVFCYTSKLSVLHR